MNRERSLRRLTAILVGHPFVHALFDYLLHGGGLSLALTAVVLADPARRHRRSGGFTLLYALQ
jgi:hypothetical protein